MLVTCRTGMINKHDTNTFDEYEQLLIDCSPHYTVDHFGDRSNNRIIFYSVKKTKKYNTLIGVVYNGKSN